MKGKIQVVAILFFAAIFCLKPAELLASSSNGTRLPPKGRAEVGYEYNAIFERNLADSYGNISTQGHFYTASLGIFDWLSIDGKIGFGDIRQKESSHLPKLEYKTGFAGGYGFRIRLFQHEKLKSRVIIGIQHISVHPQDRSIDNDKYESFLDDWQVSCLAAKDFRFLTPYVGIKGSDCEIVYNINKHDKKRRFSSRHIGLICGADFYIFDNKTRINVEARFFDETGLSTSLTYLF